MRHTILLAVALLTLAASCKNRHRVRAAEKNMTTDSTQNADSTTVSDAFADLENDMNFEEDTIFASISKGACFGRCPVYNIVVKLDGSVRYEGINFVDRMGVHTAQLSEEQMKEMEQVALDHGLDKMKDEYDSSITDLPTVYLSITMDGTRKQIKKRHGFPEELHQYQKYLDKLFDSLEWTKAGSNKE